MFIPDLTRNITIQQEAQGPLSEGGSGFQTYGPTLNEGAADYAKGPSAHRVVVFERVSSDIATGHMARIAAFYRRLDETPDVTATGRPLKDKVLKVEKPTTVPEVQPVIEAVPLETILAAQAAVAPAPTQAQGSPFGIGYFGVAGFGA